jgi:hypothetical protein
MAGEVLMPLKKSWRVFRTLTVYSDGKNSDCFVCHRFNRLGHGHGGAVRAVNHVAARSNFTAPPRH